MAIKVGMVSLGCPKNQMDAELMLAKLRAAGFTLTPESGLADVVIVNTCGFIEDAKKEAIENILEFAQLKKEGQIKRIIVTGCLAERYREELAAELPECDAVLGLGANGDIVAAVRQAMNGKTTLSFPDKACWELDGDRVLTTPGFYAYLRIGDGCDNRCAYCAIPLIRGRMRSRRMETLVEEARWLAKKGVKELVLVAQDTTLYGKDLYGELKLPELLDRLCEIEGLEWIRLLYCYPEHITDRLLDTIARQEKVVNYLDVPIQHCSERVLRSMHRPGSRQTLGKLFAHIREKVPGVVLRTTVMTGFPGETKEQFNRLGDFVQDMQFDHLGCFAYSEEEGTKAAEFEDQVDEDVRAHRADILMEQQAEVSAAKNAAKLGKRMTAVVEGYDKYAGCYFGRTAADAPDIDGKVFIKSSSRLRLGQYITVEVFDTMDYDLLAEEVTDEPAE